MKKNLLAFFTLPLLFNPIQAHSQSESKYTQEKEEKNSKNKVRDSNYREKIEAKHSEEEIELNDPRQVVLSWDSQVPSSRILKALQAGVTNQIEVLKLLSAPNVINKSIEDNKEVWTYFWLWSYKNHQDPNYTMIDMSHSGKKIKHNMSPVSLVLKFNKNDVLENVSLRLMKNQKDKFNP